MPDKGEKVRRTDRNLSICTKNKENSSNWNAGCRQPQESNEKEQWGFAWPGGVAGFRFFTFFLVILFCLGRDHQMLEASSANNSLFSSAQLFFFFFPIFSPSGEVMTEVVIDRTNNQHSSNERKIPTSSNNAYHTENQKIGTSNFHVLSIRYLVEKKILSYTPLVIFA